VPSNRQRGGDGIEQAFRALLETEDAKEQQRRAGFPVTKAKSFHHQPHPDQIQREGRDTGADRDIRAVLPECHQMERDDRAPPGVDNQLDVAELPRIVASADAAYRPPASDSDRDAQNEKQQCGSDRRSESPDGPSQQEIHIAHIADADLDPVVVEGKRQAQKHDQREDQRHHVADPRAAGQEDEDKRRQCVEHKRDREPIPVHHQFGVKRPAADQSRDGRQAHGERHADDP